MLLQRLDKQQKMEIVIMEELLLKDYLLQKVEKIVDFSFIHDLCALLYCADNERQAIDLEILFGFANFPCIIAHEYGPLLDMLRAGQTYGVYLQNR